jgi:hypothetical protein
MPTATLHSGLSNSKSTAELTTKVPIHAHQATNSALPKLMSINIPGVSATTSVLLVATGQGNNRGRRVSPAAWSDEWPENPPIYEAVDM